MAALRNQTRPRDLPLLLFANVILILLTALLLADCTTTTSALDTDASELLEEGRRIQKRFADDEFDGHTIATTSHDFDRTGRFRRSATEGEFREGMRRGGDDDVKNIRLDLASGGSLRFSLTPSLVVTDETEVFYRSNLEGRVKRQSGGGGNGCLVSGTAVDGNGMAAFSYCDGLFGLATVDGFDYLIHPIEEEGRRSRRDVSDDAHKVHVMWRRSTSELEEDVLDEPDADDDVGGEITGGGEGTTVNEVNQVSEGGSIVVEMAVFSDAAFWQRIQQRYPGREDAYLLTRLAATQAHYSDPRKVGFDFKLKVKLIEYWLEDPIEYEFNQDLGNNLKFFCRYVKERYSYDMHMMNTGITEPPDARIGVAFGRGACSKSHACFVSLPVGINAFGVYAHELGHTLGLSHPGQSKCPEDIDRINSFMGGADGGGAPYDFTPCNKWEFDRYLATGKGSCLFEETEKSKTPSRYQRLPSAFPGQFRTPDELCEILSGPDYVYHPVGPVTGENICKTKFLCINDKKKSLEFGTLDENKTPFGLPCGEEMFCFTRNRCVPLESAGVAWVVDALKASEGTSEWSSWPRKWSSCSRNCGTGVKRRQRKCKKTSLNLKPYCDGPAIQARLCNKKPCTADPEGVEELIQARGDEVCQRLKEDNPRFSNYGDTAEIFKAGRSSPDESNTCRMSCGDATGELSPLQAVLPDGTPCKDSHRDPDELKRLDIELRCVRGYCMEFSDCPAGQFKDSCGVCDGNDQRCVTIAIDSSYDVEKDERSPLAVVPAGSSYIEVNMKRNKNKFVSLELWNADDDECIIGKTGKFPDDAYEGDNAIKHGGTKWEFDRKASFIRTSGPTKADVRIKALRGSSPITEITIRYAKPEA